MEAPSPEALADLGVSVRSFRPRFHRSLLEWFRSTTDVEGLAKLGLLFQQFRDTLPDGPLADLFQLAATYMAVLRRGEAVVDASSQTLLGRIDRVLKPLGAIPTGWPGVDIRDLIDALLDAFSQVGVQPARVADIRARYQGSAAAPSASWLAMEHPSMRPAEGAPDILSTSDFSLPVAAGDETSAPILSPLMPVTRPPAGSPLAITAPLVESAETWLEAQTHRPQVGAEGGSPPDLGGLSGLGMEWEAAVLGSEEGTAVAEETAPDPFAGLGMVISADDLPDLLGSLTETGGDTLPELLDQTFTSEEDAEMLNELLDKPVLGLEVEPVAEPLPDLFLEPLKPEPGTAVADALAVESLAAESGAVASLQMLPDLHPLPAPGPSTPASSSSVAPMVAEERAVMSADALAAELELAFNSLIEATDVMEPLPTLPSAPALPESPDIPMMSAGAILPPVVQPTITPVARSVGTQASAAEEPVIRAVPASPRQCPHADSLDLQLDAVAEIGLHGARLAQRNSQLGCGLAEFDLSLRCLRQQLRRLESEIEVTDQDPGRLAGADRTATLRLGVRGLNEALTQLVGLRDQLASSQRGSAELLAQQTRLVDELQEGISSGRTERST